MKPFFVQMILMLGGILSTLPGTLWAAPFPAENGEAIVKQAVIRAETSMVRIETVGGTDTVEGMLISTGATTGIIVSDDGYIITSSFNFASNPSSVLVTLPGRQQREIAKIVSRDHLKQLTLLKVEATGLTAAESVPVETIQVGQWGIALGKTYDANLPNVSLGLVSALGRMEGRALQTDAKVSPVNYGGPLVDLQGRVLGVLSPLAPHGRGVTEGVNWYDSGIGFAIPFSEVQRQLETMKAGEDLQPGFVGISFSGQASFLAEPVIEEVRPNSPASEAGLKVKDRVVSVSGREVFNVAAYRQVVGRMYAGETLALKIRRGDEQFDAELILADELEPFHFGWLGMLLAQSRLADAEGVEIRHLLPGSAAEQAGLKKEDRIVQIDEDKVKTLAELRSKLLVKASGELVDLKVQRGGEELGLTAKLADLPQTLPEEVPLPLIGAEPKSGEAEKIETGDLQHQLEGRENRYQIYVPENYQTEVEYGCLFWLSSRGETIPANQLSEWKRLARTRGYLLVIPLSSDPSPWSADDTTVLLETLSDVAKRYSVDPGRVCLVADGENPMYAWQLAFGHREKFQGLLALNVPRRLRVPFNEPGKRLQILLAIRAKAEQEIASRILKMLEPEAFPVLSVGLEENWQSEDYDAFGRWLELMGSL